MEIKFTHKEGKALTRLVFQLWEAYGNRRLLLLAPEGIAFTNGYLAHGKWVRLPLRRILVSREGDRVWGVMKSLVEKEGEEVSLTVKGDNLLLGGVVFPLEAQHYPLRSFKEVWNSPQGVVKGVPTSLLRKGEGVLRGNTLYLGDTPFPVEGKGFEGVLPLAPPSLKDLARGWGGGKLTLKFSSSPTSGGDKVNTLLFSYREGGELWALTNSLASPESTP